MTDERDADHGTDDQDGRPLPGILEVDVRREAGGPVVAAAGEIDLYSLPMLRNELVKLLAEGETNIVVDLHGVRLLDTSALSALLGVRERLRQRGGALRLVGVQPGPRRVIEITGLQEQFGLD